jgi:hypothetical protein
MGPALLNASRVLKAQHRANASAWREKQKAADDIAAAARRELGLKRAQMKKFHAAAAAAAAATKAAAAALPRPASKRSKDAADAEDGIHGGDESPATAKPLKRGRAHITPQGASPAPTSGKRALENPHPRARSIKKPLAADGPDINPERFPPERLSRRPKAVGIVGLCYSDGDADAAGGESIAGAAGADGDADGDADGAWRGVADADIDADAAGDQDGAGGYGDPRMAAPATMTTLMMTLSLPYKDPAAGGRWAHLLKMQPPRELLLYVAGFAGAVTGPRMFNPQTSRELMHKLKPKANAQARKNKGAARGTGAAAAAAADNPYRRHYPEPSSQPTAAAAGHALRASAAAAAAARRNVRPLDVLQP